MPHQFVTVLKAVAIRATGTGCALASMLLAVCQPPLPMTLPQLRRRRSQIHAALQVPPGEIIRTQVWHQANSETTIAGVSQTRGKQ